MVKNINSIIDFWDRAGISSSTSSTCAGNPLHHDFDNKIEKYKLSSILNNIIVNERNLLHFSNAIDIGAGLGRFIPTLKNFSHNITALEPANKVYQQLLQFWSDDQTIRFERNSWESHISSAGKTYDLILASGVLYFYDQKMLNSFFKSLREGLSDDGVFIARDFLTSFSKTIPSSYLPGKNCYYRDVDFWRTLAKSYDLRLRYCTLSKPQLLLLRNKYISRILRFLRIESLIWNHRLLYAWSKSRPLLEIDDLNSHHICTCFLIFSR